MASAGLTMATRGGNLARFQIKISRILILYLLSLQLGGSRATSSEKNPYEEDLAMDPEAYGSESSIAECEYAEASFGDCDPVSWKRTKVALLINSLNESRGKTCSTNKTEEQECAWKDLPKGTQLILKSSKSMKTKVASCLDTMKKIQMYMLETKEQLKTLDNLKENKTAVDKVKSIAYRTLLEQYKVTLKIASNNRMKLNYSETTTEDKQDRIEELSKKVEDLSMAIKEDESIKKDCNCENSESEDQQSSETNDKIKPDDKQVREEYKDDNCNKKWRQTLAMYRNCRAREEKLLQEKQQTADSFQMTSSAKNNFDMTSPPPYDSSARLITGPSPSQDTYEVDAENSLRVVEGQTETSSSSVVEHEGYLRLLLKTKEDVERMHGAEIKTLNVLIDEFKRGLIASHNREAEMEKKVRYQESYIKALESHREEGSKRIQMLEEKNKEQEMKMHRSRYRTLEVINHLHAFRKDLDLTLNKCRYVRTHSVAATKLQQCEEKKNKLEDEKKLRQGSVKRLQHAMNNLEKKVENLTERVRDGKFRLEIQKRRHERFLTLLRNETKNLGGLQDKMGGILDGYNDMRTKYRDFEKNCKSMNNEEVFSLSRIKYDLDKMKMNMKVLFNNSITISSSLMEKNKICQASLSDARTRFAKLPRIMQTLRERLYLFSTNYVRKLTTSLQTNSKLLEYEMSRNKEHTDAIETLTRSNMNLSNKIRTFVIDYIHYSPVYLGQPSKLNESYVKSYKTSNEVGNLLGIVGQEIKTFFSSYKDRLSSEKQKLIRLMAHISKLKEVARSGAACEKLLGNSRSQFDQCKDKLEHEQIHLYQCHVRFYNSKKVLKDVGNFYTYLLQKVARLYEGVRELRGVGKKLRENLVKAHTSMGQCTGSLQALRHECQGLVNWYQNQPNIDMLKRKLDSCLQDQSQNFNSETNPSFLMEHIKDQDEKLEELKQQVAACRHENVETKALTQTSYSEPKVGDNTCPCYSREDIIKTNKALTEFLMNSKLPNVTEEDLKSWNQEDLRTVLRGTEILLKGLKAAQKEHDQLIPSQKLLESQSEVEKLFNENMKTKNISTEMYEDMLKVINVSFSELKNREEYLIQELTECKNSDGNHCTQEDDDNKTKDPQEMDETSDDKDEYDNEMYKTSTEKKKNEDSIDEMDKHPTETDMGSYVKPTEYSYPKPETTAYSPYEDDDMRADPVKYQVDPTESAMMEEEENDLQPIDDMTLSTKKPFDINKIQGLINNSSLLSDPKPGGVNSTAIDHSSGNVNNSLSTVEDELKLITEKLTEKIEGHDIGSSGHSEEKSSSTSNPSGVTMSSASPPDVNIDKIKAMLDETKNIQRK